MHAVSVSGLKHNPAAALRQARSSPVVVLNRDHPDAVLIGLEQGGVLQAPGVRAALATALFRDGELSLARAARMAEMDVASFISHLGRLGIRVGLVFQQTLSRRRSLTPRRSRSFLRTAKGSILHVAAGPYICPARD